MEHKTQERCNALMRRLRVEYLNVGLKSNADTALLRFMKLLDGTTEDSGTVSQSVWHNAEDLAKIV
jgi:hypothetical protein